MEKCSSRTLLVPLNTTKVISDHPRNKYGIQRTLYKLAGTRRYADLNFTDSVILIKNHIRRAHRGAQLVEMTP